MSVPAIAPTRTERRLEEAMRRLLRAHHALTQTGQLHPAPIIGGTTLRLAVGLPRPSTDIDIVVLDPQRRVVIDELPVAADAAGMTFKKAQKRNNRSK